MKLMILSDLHNEFEPDWRRRVEHVARQGRPKDRPCAQVLVDGWAARPSNHPYFGPDLSGFGDVDLVLLAGDIDIGVAAVEYAAEVAGFLGCPVAYTPGNHEFYKHDMQGMLADLRACADATNGRVYLLDRDRLDLDVDGCKVAVLGTTLWTDYEVYGDPVTAMAVAGEQLNDHRLIRWQSGDSSHAHTWHHFRPGHALSLHQEARAWLSEQAPKARQEADTVVVMTHHAPIPEGNPPQHQGGPLSPAFVSDMRAEIEAWGVDVWAFGHTHHSIDTQVGRTRVVSAQRGYVGSEKDADVFVPLIVDLNRKDGE